MRAAVTMMPASENRSVVEPPSSALRVTGAIARDSMQVPASPGGPSAFERRPWGGFTVLDEGHGYKVKRIEVAPGHRLSYQKHAQRAEHWMVVAGWAKVILDGRAIDVRLGETVDVPVGAAHRVENPGHEPLIFVEVQLGSYLGEDDIVRLQDDYGRSAG